jgi:hypothetical protein
VNGEAALPALLARYPPEVGAAALAVRAVILEVLPQAREQVDPADHLIGFGIPDPRTGRVAWDVVAVVLHRDHVNLQLGNGATLVDPAGLLQRSGKRARHVACRSAADAARPPMRDLIRAQAMLRGLLPVAPDDH